MNKFKDSIAQKITFASGQYERAAKLQDWPTAHYYQGFIEGLTHAVHTFDQLDSERFGTHELQGKTIGDRIAELRKAKGMKQSTLGKLVGKSAGAIGNWERCSREVPINVLPKLATALHVPVSTIVDTPKKPAAGATVTDSEQS
jgi:DNA-binding XRE family transcriptional regulator